MVVEAHDAAGDDDVDPWNVALRHIFTFYSDCCHRQDQRTMDLTQFYTFAKDVPNIVCGRISQGDLGVVFSAGQGLQCRLKYPQFLEALVWLAAKKFVNDEPHMAYCRLLTEHVFCVDCAPLNVRSDARSLFLARRAERERAERERGHGGHGGHGGRQDDGSRGYGGATADARRQRLGHNSTESLRLDYSCTSPTATAGTTREQAFRVLRRTNSRIRIGTNATPTSILAPSQIPTPTPTPAPTPKTNTNTHTNTSTIAWMSTTPEAATRAHHTRSRRTSPTTRVSATTLSAAALHRYDGQNS